MRRLLLVALVFALAVSAVGSVVYRDTNDPYVREVVVPVRGLTREVRLLQVSDAHSRQFGPRQERVDAALGKSRFDAAVLTGDVVDSPNAARPPAFELADVLRRHTEHVYYLPGNHDPVQLGSLLEQFGVVPMTPGLVIPLGEQRTGVALAYAPSAAAIARAHTSAAELVLASHTPPNAGRLAAARALPGRHLFIAGHTHGGQIRLPFLGAIQAPLSWEGEDGGHPGDNEIVTFPELQGRLVAGDYERDGQRIHVSTGLGTTGFVVGGLALRIRFLDRSEMVLYRFVPTR